MPPSISVWSATASTPRSGLNSLEFRIGTQGIAFDRLELDAWVDHHKTRNGRPGQRTGDRLWDANERPASFRDRASGTSTSKSGEAATEYSLEGTKRSLDRDAQALKIVDEFIGTLPLHQVHMGTLQGFIAARAKNGVKSATVNRTLAVIQRVLNLAARLWRDDNGLTWLETPPLIQFVDWDDTRKPCPLSWEEQDRLLQALPFHLQPMALFALDTRGPRKNRAARCYLALLESHPAPLDLQARLL